MVVYEPHAPMTLLEMIEALIEWLKFFGIRVPERTIDMSDDEYYEELVQAIYAWAHDGEDDDDDEIMSAGLEMDYDDDDYEY